MERDRFHEKGKDMRKASFAARLQQVREQAGLSQYELAKRTGLSRQAVSQLEMGQSEPSWTTVQFLAAALGADYAAFADPELKLPDAEPPRPRGRPRKAADRGETAPKAKAKRRQK